MGILTNLLNGLVDIVKLVLIAVICLFVVFLGGYLLGDLIGLIPEATGLHRELSVQTFMTDLPFIGTNMIYLLIAMALLVIAVVAIELYSRRQTAKSETVSEAPENVQAEGAEVPGKKQAEPKAPEIKK
jgi:ABC-type uncharacterized transport system permease subunit